MMAAHAAVLLFLFVMLFAFVDVWFFVRAFHYILKETAIQFLKKLGVLGGKSSLIIQMSFMG